jgi:hypothetical protein
MTAIMRLARLCLRNKNIDCLPFQDWRNPLLLTLLDVLLVPNPILCLVCWTLSSLTMLVSDYRYAIALLE